MSHTLSRTGELMFNKLLTIRKEGGSKVITVTKLLPPDWHFIEVEKEKEAKEFVILKIKKVR